MDAAYPETSTSSAAVWVNNSLQVLRPPPIPSEQETSGGASLDPLHGRRGSTVRVRQRAYVKCLQIASLSFHVRHRIRRDGHIRTRTRRSHRRNRASFAPYRRVSVRPAARRSIEPLAARPSREARVEAARLEVEARVPRVVPERLSRRAEVGPDVAPDRHHRDDMGAGELQRRRGALPSSAARERVVDKQYRHPRHVLRRLVTVVARAVVVQILTALERTRDGSDRPLHDRTRPLTGVRPERGRHALPAGRRGAEGVSVRQDSPCPLDRRPGKQALDHCRGAPPRISFRGSQSQRSAPCRSEHPLSRTAYRKSRSRPRDPTSSLAVAVGRVPRQSRASRVDLRRCCSASSSS